ncbi:predicted protein [Plenodomus lingam JN3]|uniref:Predicted protein n=1 Tax=Leptosphaeria maculans (strain JN3 / isolate v23.1.3 / race Av1-4-5-6-7-8) TaxID=985895 RepID=E4ZYB5_LEPMJ|nr:predicted protein [Plenodomus lingam JN3]CBX96360.1 predicted protein [Plenodomus lingam JN3]
MSTPSPPPPPPPPPPLPALPPTPSFLLPSFPFTPSTPLPNHTPATPSPLPVDFLEILENWCIPNLDTSAILPASLIGAAHQKQGTTCSNTVTPGPAPVSPVAPTTPTPTKKPTYPWTDPLRNAILTLSKLTVNQRARAHSLLCTYFAARIREASYKANGTGIYAQLEVCDVDKAIESVRRMRRGREMEMERKREKEEDVGEKRKYSIGDEGWLQARFYSRQLGSVMEGDGDEEGEKEEEEEEEGKGKGRESRQSGNNVQSPPLSNGFHHQRKKLQTSHSHNSTTPDPAHVQGQTDIDSLHPLLTPQTTKRLIHLPPIQTTDINTPTKPVVRLDSTGVRAGRGGDLGLGLNMDMDMDMDMGVGADL